MQSKKEQSVNIGAYIRVLNDRLRRRHIGGRIILTSGVNALDANIVKAIIGAIAQFTDFNEHNDPYGEHDCAIVETLGLSILWKIEYFDETLSMHSPDPADENVTSRVLTIMLADEY